MDLKDFDGWMKMKKQIQAMDGRAFAHPREIWWCALGVNVGAETDGKNENFERPIIVMKVYNKETLLVLPLTSKEKSDAFHYKIATSQKVGWAKLTQHRVISNKRLIRKVDTLDEEQFEALKEAWKSSL